MRAGRGQRGGRAGESQGGKCATERHKWSQWSQWPDLRVGQERGSSVIRGNHCLLHVQGENW